MRKIIKTLKYLLLRYRLRKVDATIEKNCLSAELDIDDSACVKISKDCIFREGVKINVRNNAVLQIGEKSFFNYNCVITSRKSIIVGTNVAVGPNCCFFDHNHNYKVEESSENYVTDDIFIGNNVWIGANCIILKGTEIGENSVIGANTVLAGKKIPPNSICYGYQKVIVKPK